ncbi:MAG: antitoxin [Nocardioidaceae bacterium]|nr:antitoxin [Nocardioidaceae bacterium]
MGFLDKVKGKAADAVDKHGDKISGGLDKAGQFVDKKTKGKYSDKIATGKEKISGGMDKLEKSPEATSSGTPVSPIDPVAARGAASPPPWSDSAPDFNPAPVSGNESGLSPSAPESGAEPMDPTSVESADSALKADVSDDSTQPPSAPSYPPAP